MIIKTLLVLAVLFSLFFIFRFVFFSFKTYEEPSYKLIKKTKSIEIRQYQAFNLASTDISGNKEQALRRGFRRLAGYIFGKNDKRQSLSMTVPVMLESHASDWRVSFMLPRIYALNSLPKPDDTSIFLHIQNQAIFAAIRFSGQGQLNNFIEKRVVLEEFLTKNHCLNQGRVVYAFYNPPWTIPLLRRNEVWIELTQSCQFELTKDEK
jgi:SOUL heme-binding protein